MCFKIVIFVMIVTNFVDYKVLVNKFELPFDLVDASKDNLTEIHP